MTSGSAAAGKSGESGTERCRALMRLAGRYVWWKKPEDAGGFIVETAEGVLLSFLGGIDNGRVEPPDTSPGNRLPVASALDLLATKLKTILQRAAAKHYADIAALLGSGLALERGLGAARALYGPGYPPMESLRALCWFGDGDLGTLAEDDRRTLAASARKPGQIRKAGRADTFWNQAWMAGQEPATSISSA